MLYAKRGDPQQEESSSGLEEGDVNEDTKEDAVEAPKGDNVDIRLNEHDDKKQNEWNDVFDFDDKSGNPSTYRPPKDPQIKRFEQVATHDKNNTKESKNKNKVLKEIEGQDDETLASAVRHFIKE